MKAKILIVLLIATVVNACNKDKYTTKPQLFFKSVNSTTIPNQSIITFKIDFTDKEGDVQDTIYIARVSKICQGSVIKDFKYPVPAFSSSSNQQGTFEINFAYNAIGTGYPSITGCGNKNDTSYFRFCLRDKAKNFSDTLQSPDIAFLK